MKTPKRIFRITTAAALLAAATLSAQVKITVEETSYDQGEAQNSIQTIQIDNRYGMRLDEKSPEGQSAFIFNKQDKSVIVAQFSEGTYFVMTQEDFNQMKQMRQQMAPQMDAMSKMMEEKMKGLSDEEREAMKKYSPMGKMMGAEPEKVVYRKAGTEKMDQWNCTHYIGEQGGQKVEEVWTADFAELGLSAADFDVMSEFGEMMAGLAGDEDDANTFRVGSKEWEEEQGYSGIPVKTVEYRDGEDVESTEVLKAVTKAEIDPAQFTSASLGNLRKTESPMKQMKQGMPGMPNMQDDQY